MNESSYVEPAFDTDAAATATANAKRVLENEKIDRRNRAAHKLQQFVEQLRAEERCVVFAVPTFTPDGRTTAHIAVDALD